MDWSLGEIRSDKAIRYCLNFALIVTLTSFFFLGLAWLRLPPEVPFFYSLPWGEEQLAPATFLWFLPATSLAILFLNLFLARFFFSDKLLARILAFVASLYALLSAITLFRIVTLIC